MSKAPRPGFVHVRPHRVADVVAGSLPRLASFMSEYTTRPNIDEPGIGTFDMQQQIHGINIFGSEGWEEDKGDESRILKDQKRGRNVRVLSSTSRKELVPNAARNPE